MVSQTIGDILKPGFSFTTNTDTNVKILKVLPVIGQQEKVGPITRQYRGIFVFVILFVVKLKGHVQSGR